jgi:hypothetical protein
MKHAVLDRLGMGVAEKKENPRPSLVVTREQALTLESH